MNTYHKIQTIFKRKIGNNSKTLLLDQYSCPEFKFLKDNTWVFTEKLDGTCMRVMFRPNDVGGEISFNGKTDRAQVYMPLLENLQQVFLPQYELFAQQFDHPVCLYGEGVGPKIQKNGERYTTEQNSAQHFVLFDVKIGNDDERCWWLKREDVEDIAKLFDIEIAPIVGYGTLDDMLLLCQNGFGSQWGDFTAEGIVARPQVDLLCRSGQRIITKLKYKDFEH